MIKSHKKLKKFLLVLSVLIGVLFLSILVIFSFYYNKYKLDIGKLTSVNNGIVVYSANGQENTLHNTNRSIVEIETLPEHVKNAFIAIEDKRFYSHNGYDLKRIAKSALVNLTNKSKSQGASTISQQLIKNALLTNEKTYSRKFKEIILSIKMEKQFTKDEILEMYLNTIYFGSNAYGIENASKIYFNKSAKNLSLNEACCLAGLIKSPKMYSPRINYENANNRKNLVATKMLDMQTITHAEYSEIVSSPIVISSEYKIDDGYEKEAIYEACRLLNLNERDLINRNYKLITFKQDDLQQHVIQTQKNIINSAEESSYSSLDSLSIVTNTDGHVLAYYENSNYNLHNLKRQPASTIKPIGVYLPCFQHNILSPASLILDEEINYNGFSPQNADKSFHGYVSVREALSKSLNIPAVKALDYVGVKKARETLSRLGINITNSDLNLSLALGAVKNGVNLLDLLASYTPLANLGTFSNLCFIDKILDEKGQVIYSHENFKTIVADKESCFLVTDILKDCAKTGNAKRLESLNIPIASKTGTASCSTGNTDLYNIAFTTEHLMLTWIADIDKKTLPVMLHSSSHPTQINKEISSYLYKKHSPLDFVTPDGVSKVAYDLIEKENNHIIVQPNHNIERYIAYDYFKANNIPTTFFSHSENSFKLNLTKQGAIIEFQAKKNKVYNVYKRIQNQTILLEKIIESNDFIKISDTDVFKYEQIEYFICDDNNKILTEIKTIRPKDFLINLLNNEVLSSKKQWLV